MLGWMPGLKCHGDQRNFETNGLMTSLTGCVNKITAGAGKTGGRSFTLPNKYSTKRIFHRPDAPILKALCHK